MARMSWLDDTTDSPIIDDRVTELTHFMQAMADGVIDRDELSAQESKLTAALRAAEATLDDEAHALVTTALLELTAYNIMATLSEVQKVRLRAAIS